MATLWIIFTTFIGWLIGWAFTDEHEFICAVIGFCAGFMTGFVTPVDEH